MNKVEKAELKLATARKELKKLSPSDPGYDLALSHVTDCLEELDKANAFANSLVGKLFGKK